MNGAPYGAAALRANLLTEQLCAVEDGCKDGHMADLTLSQERANRESAIERTISRQNCALIEEGIESYKRELPKLIEARKEFHKVAYRGSERVGIAPTYHKLERLLKKKGFSDERELFIISIAPMEGVEQDSHSR